MAENKEYLIPKNLKVKYEFFPGFGFKEALVSIIGIGISLVISYFLYLLAVDIIMIICIFSVLSILSFGLVFQIDPRISMNAIDIIKLVKHFAEKQKRFYYF